MNKFTEKDIEAAYKYGARHVGRLMEDHNKIVNAITDIRDRLEPLEEMLPPQRPRKRHDHTR